MAKILVVDDEVGIRELLRDALVMKGYEVHQAANGEEGLKLAEKIKPDCIVCDVVMPEMDGNKLFKALRATDFGKKIPFIVLTARAKMKDYFEVIDVDTFIDKPCEIAEVIEAVEKALRGEKPIRKPMEKRDKKDNSDADIEISAGVGVVLETDMIDAVKPADVSQKSPERKKAPKPKEKTAAEKKKILIVDDTKIVYEELKKTLLKHNCDILVVHTPAKCLRELNRFFPDIVMSKFILAEMNADQMANIIKEMSRFKAIPIIIYENIGQEVDDDKSSEPDAKRFVLNAEGYDVLKKVTELLQK